MPWQGDAATSLRYRTDYLSNCSAICGAWFACARTAIVDCCRICVRTISDTAFATSASRMRLFAAPAFSDATPRLSIECSSRFCMAPINPRCVLTVSTAASSAEMNDSAPSALEGKAPEDVAHDDELKSILAEEAAQKTQKYP